MKKFNSLILNNTVNFLDFIYSGRSLQRFWVLEVIARSPYFAFLSVLHFKESLGIKNEKTTIIYESPKRLKKLLNELLEFCGGDREIMVARELTKKFEEHVGNNINEVIEFFNSKNVIGEITIVLKGKNKQRDLNFDKFDIKKDLNDLINAGLSLSAASKYLAKKNGLKKSEIYNLN